MINSELKIICWVPSEIAVLLAPYLAPLKGFPIMYNHPALVDFSEALINNPD
jgi:hypothetical protein